VLRQIFQKFEFLIGQVKRPAAQPRGVGALVDDQLAQTDLADVLLIGHAAATSNQQPQPGVDLGGSGARQQNLVETPFDVDGDQAALVDDGHHRHRRSRRAK
jgi:hypothetical protein